MKSFTWLKSLLALVMLSLSATSTVFAGGILTNTNLSARYARLLALEASISVDAAYHNPAGTIKLPEGFHFAVANQTIIQERKITSTFPYMMDDGPKDFIGKTSSPVVPSIQGVYKKGRWAISGSFGVVGGGGKATFNNGLPSFESGIAMLAPTLSAVSPTLIGITPGLDNASIALKDYSINQYVQGESYFFGLQLGAAYQINDMFSLYGGARLSVINNSYVGHLTDLKMGLKAEGMEALNINSGMNSPKPVFDWVHAVVDGAQKNPNVPEQSKKELAALVAGIALPTMIANNGAYLDAEQSGWGVAPIIGVHFSHAGLNMGARYEFKTGFDVKNKTSNKDNIGMFVDGEKVDHDLPAMFSMGASYDILPNLTASIGYHHFFEKDAAMSGGKQKLLSGNTNEYLAGVEYQINDMFLVSAGTQFTRFGMTDEFQSDLSFFLNSYSIGFGGAVNLSETVQLNAGYFFTNYSDYTKKTAVATDIYNRENKIFAIGVEFSF